MNVLVFVKRKKKSKKYCILQTLLIQFPSKIQTVIFMKCCVKNATLTKVLSWINILFFFLSHVCSVLISAMFVEVKLYKCVGSPASRSFPRHQARMVLFMLVWRHLWHSVAVVVFFLKVFQWHFQNSFRASRQISDLCSTRPYGEHRDLWSYDNTFALRGEGLCCYGDDYMCTLWPYPGQ